MHETFAHQPIDLLEYAPARPRQATHDLRSSRRKSVLPGSTRSGQNARWSLCPPRVQTLPAAARRGPAQPPRSWTPTPRAALRGKPPRLWIEQERLITTRTLTLSGMAIKSTPRAEIYRYAELRMISRASRRSVEFLFAPSAIPCIKRSKLSVASRSTSCAIVVSEGHAY